MPAAGFAFGVTFAFGGTFAFGVTFAFGAAFAGFVAGVAAVAWAVLRLGCAEPTSRAALPAYGETFSGTPSCS